MESKFGNLDLYDKIMGDVCANVLNESGRTNNQIYLKWFNPDDCAQRVYFHGAAIISDIFAQHNICTIYLNMSLWKYIPFKIKNWKRRKQIKWISENKVPLTATPVRAIIDHIEGFNEIRSEANVIWQDILDKYYEPKKGETNK